MTFARGVFTGAILGAVTALALVASWWLVTSKPPQKAKSAAAPPAKVDKPLKEDEIQRITLTPSGWRAAHARLLLIRGQRKREVFEHALATGEVSYTPVVAAAAEGAVPLHVHWSP